MRTLILLLTTVSIAPVLSQWSTDPADPLLVAPATGAPAGMMSFADGSGGCYVFWRDKRADGTNFDVYGQRLDAEGFPLWAPNGTAMFHEEGSSVSDLGITRLADGRLMLTVIAGAGNFTDTLKALLLDADAQPLWDGPVNITAQGSPVLYLGELDIVPASDGAIIGWYDTYLGGSNGINVTRVNNDGEVLWSPDGYAIPSGASGPFNLLPDQADGVLVLWRQSNGLGSGYSCMRVDSTGANAWDANVTVNAGGPGFGGNHKIVQGPDADLLMAYTDQQYNVQLVQLDTTGALVLDPSPVPVCGFASDQGQVSLLHQNGFTTVVWGDNRPPASNQDLYMQRFDGDGNLLLDPDGVLVMHLNTYIPTSGLVPSLDEGIIATFDGTVDGYSAMRMNADGTPVWTAPTAFCTSSFNPAYENQVQLPDGEGGIISVWTTFNSEVRAARIYANGELGNHVGLEERTATALRVRPNPAEQQLAIDLAGDERIIGAEVIDLTGGVHTVSVSGRSLDLAGLAAGTYSVRIRTENSVHTARFIKR